MTTDESKSNGDDGGVSLVNKAEEINLNFQEKWNFELNELYKLSKKFFKDNENKAFHLTYDDRNRFHAYSLQATHGAFNQEKASPLGHFDIIGRDRRQAWCDLNEMPKEQAMMEFIELLDKLCVCFKPYVEAHKRENDERKRLQLIEEERLKKLDEERIQKEQLEKEEERQRLAIKEALNQQTYEQFSAYALQQYPNDKEEQLSLIKRLQEQHYQQYVQQMIQLQMNSLALQQQQQQVNNSSNNMNISNNTNNQSSNVPNGPRAPLLNKSSEGTTKNCEPIYKSTVNTMNSNENGSVNDEVENLSKEISKERKDVPDELEDEEEDADEEEDDDEEEEETGPMANAQMWTRKEIKVFKESISKDSGDGIIKVGHGEIVTVRVPTHPEGTCIFWEFATDSYDIGFGLLFEWTKNPGNQVSVHISESEDEEDDDDDEDEDVTNATAPSLNTVNENHQLSLNDIEKGKKTKSTSDYSAPCSVIIPIYRRNSHEEVFAGSHPYPGTGVYLLKFDNSYSLWRSKTLYYRVYYTK